MPGSRDSKLSTARTPRSSAHELTQDRAGLRTSSRPEGPTITGRFKPDLAVGLGTGDLDVPGHALEELAARRA